jgi:hypothetical protein
MALGDVVSVAVLAGLRLVPMIGGEPRLDGNCLHYDATAPAAEQLATIGRLTVEWHEVTRVTDYTQPIRIRGRERDRCRLG